MKTSLMVATSVRDVREWSNGLKNLTTHCTFHFDAVSVYLSSELQKQLD